MMRDDVVLMHDFEMLHNPCTRTFTFEGTCPQVVACVTLRDDYSWHKQKLMILDVKPGEYSRWSLQNLLMKRAVEKQLADDSGCEVDEVERFMPFNLNFVPYMGPGGDPFDRWIWF